jgi:hypothetical protein
MPPSRIATLLRLFQQTPPQGVADNEEVGNALAQLAQNIRPTGARNGLEEFAQLPGHALANSIEGAGALIQPEKIAQGIRGVIQDPQPALDGIKGFASEVAERPVALLEQLSLSDAIPGLTAGKFLGAASAVAGAVPPGGNKFLKKLGKSTDNLTPTQRRLRELAEGVENPGALERGRLEGQLSKASDDFNIDALAMRRSDLILQKPPMGSLEHKELVEITSKIDNFRNRELGRLNDKRLAGDAKRGLRALDNLDPVEKARLDRAVQQGFDLDAYHGTKGDIQSFDPGLLGATTGAPSARVGFFFAADPATAATYARTASADKLRPEIADRSARVRAEVDRLSKEKIDNIKALSEAEAGPLRIERDKMKDIQFGVLPNDTGMTIDEVIKRKQQLNVEIGKIETKNHGKVRRDDLIKAREEMAQLADSGQNILPVKFRLQNPLVHDFGGGSYREVSYKDLLDQAQRDGKDGAIFRNTRDGGPVTDIYVVFEPSQVRSKYAAFDPSRASSGDITATMPPLLFPIGIGAAAAAFSADRE